jgi:hypothetical protein
VKNVKRVVQIRKDLCDAWITETLNRIFAYILRSGIKITAKEEKPGSRFHFSSDNLKGDNLKRAWDFRRKLILSVEKSACFEEQSFVA